MNSAPEEQPEPLPVTIEETVAVMMVSRAEVDISAPDFADDFRAESDSAWEFYSVVAPPERLRRIAWDTVRDLVPQLTASGLVALDGNLLRRNTSRCVIWGTVLGLFAGDNRDGRFLPFLSRETHSALYTRGLIPTQARFGFVACSH